MATISIDAHSEIVARRRQDIARPSIDQNTNHAITSCVLFPSAPKISML
jgi:hypothetical protein